jgi:hypothetical protein
MMQASIPRLHHFALRNFSEKDPSKFLSRCADTWRRPRHRFLPYWDVSGRVDPVRSATPISQFATCSNSRESNHALAEQGRCGESISALKHAMAAPNPADVRKQDWRARRSLFPAMDDRDSTDEFIQLLTKQFRKDPDVLFVIVHAYSDLSTRTAQDLGRDAPQSDRRT